MERSENDDVYFAQDFNIFVLRIYFGSSSGACLLRRIYHPWRKIDSLINLINSTHLKSISLHGHEIIQAFLFRSKPAPQHDLDPRSLKNVRNILHFFRYIFSFLSRTADNRVLLSRLRKRGNEMRCGIFVSCGPKRNVDNRRSVAK